MTTLKSRGMRGSEAARSRMRPVGKALLPLLLVVLPQAGRAVQLENWRLPFYRMAADRGDVTASPSRMFWDNLTQATVLDSRLWPDSARYARNHWSVEPSLRLDLSSDSSAFLTGRHANIHFDFLSDIRYGRLSVRNVLDVDQRYKKDPSYPAHTERGAAGSIAEAYLQYTGNHGFARLGRLKRNWGPFPDHSILLSSNPYGYDAFEWQVYAPFFEFRHLFAAFPNNRRAWQDFGGGSGLGTKTRYFAAHALNFIVGSWASVGVSETVVFSRDKGVPDFQYVNPFSIYSVINTNQEGPGNLMLGLQGWLHPYFDNVILRGQVVFDDIQVDDNGPSDQEPTHWAGDWSGVWKDPLTTLRLPHQVKLDYHYLSKWVYTVSNGNTTDDGERYTYLGRSLAYPAIDGDQLRLTATVMGRNYWAASVGGGFARQDTGSITTLWPVYSESSGALGYRHEAALSKRTKAEKSISAVLAADGYFRAYASLHLEFENRWVKNKNHVVTRSYEYDPRFSLSATLHYSAFPWGWKAPRQEEGAK